MTDAVLWTTVAVAGPLIAAVVALSGWSAALRAGLALGSGTSLAAALGLARAVLREGPGRHLLGGWGAPLGIELWVDGLTVVMLGMTAAVGTAVSVYATAYFGELGSPGEEEPPGRGARFFAPLSLFLWAALNALYLSADLFNLYVTVELFGLTSAAIITLAVSTRATVAGMRYLLVSLVGSMLFLLGVALLYLGYGVLGLEELARLSPEGVLPSVALAAMTVGLIAKAGLFPFHAWLPPAHSSAPTPGSALLSALVVKASFYIVLRLWVTVWGGGTRTGLLALGILGGAAILWGSILALRQTSLKRLIAYSTVAQVGYLFVMFPLLVSGSDGAWSVDAWHGGVYQAVSHGLAKAAMFLAAGGMTYAVARDDLESISGVAHRMPVSFFAFALAGLTMAGIPPSGGFVGKWLLIRSAVSSGRWGWVVLLAVGGLLAAAYVVRALQHALEDPAAEAEGFRTVPRRLEWSALAMAVVSVILGLRPLEIIRVLDIGGIQPW